MKTTAEKTVVTVQVLVHAPIKKVWRFWADPKHITQWNNASDDWHSPEAENDLRVGGRFRTRMEAKDGSAGFDFGGTYDYVVFHKQIEYTMDDGRKAQISFVSNDAETLVIESFEAENENSVEMQQTGWQNILDNFKSYAELTPLPDTLHFEIKINAPAQKVYDTMIGEKTYAQWTVPFNPTSHFTGSWVRGSRIRFIGNDENGKLGGIVGIIRENIPTKFISIEYLGLIQDDNEITSGFEVEEWIGASESYTFTETKGTTLLGIDLDAKDDFLAYLKDTWPIALKTLKAMCEE
jgi:uncharacterized protein YndB with AHSA1/START domain